MAKNHRKGRLALAATLLLFPPATAPARAFTAPTRVRIVDEAIRLMPKSLRLALERHRDEVQRGALEPLTREDESAHRPPLMGGSLERSVAQAADDLVAAVREPQRFAEVCRRFGALAHYVTDAGFPPNASGLAGNGRYDHFSRYTAEKLPKFPLVFHGHDDESLARGDFAAFATSVLEEARAEDAYLARAYAAAGTPPNPAYFDDRSIPFAVASLAYSRTVTYVARAWLEAWRQAGGDMGRTPYFKPPSPGPPKQEE